MQKFKESIFNQAYDLISKNQRLNTSTAKDLFNHCSDIELSILANLKKNNFHNPQSATYLKMAIINYTNICVAKCDYCAFYRLPHQKDTYLLTYNQICQKIDELVSHGATLVAFNGGFNPKLKIDSYLSLFDKLHRRYPGISFFEMTVAEFMFVCKISKISYHQAAKLFKKIGTKWITGGGAEILTDSFRMRHSPGKYYVHDYLSAQKAILDNNIGSTATMVIGFDESLDERFDHLDTLRCFQDNLPNKLKSFLCWSYKPDNTELKGKEISDKEYLRWISISRIYLDNFKHIRASILTQNENALLALGCGADDFDLPMEDEVTESAGAVINLDFDHILERGANLGLKLKKRDPWTE